MLLPLDSWIAERNPTNQTRVYKYFLFKDLCRNWPAHLSFTVIAWGSMTPIPTSSRDKKVTLVRTEAQWRCGERRMGSLKKFYPGMPITIMTVINRHLTIVYTESFTELEHEKWACNMMRISDCQNVVVSVSVISFDSSWSCMEIVMDFVKLFHNGWYFPKPRKEKKNDESL